MNVTVFLKDEIIARGTADGVAGKIAALEPLSRSSDLLAFDDESGKQIDLDLSRREMPGRSRGRPSLGVQAREVTLLPRHWEWLSTQPGGASTALRKLVEEARRRGRSERECRDAAYRFLTVMAGDRCNYEEAMRALYAGDRRRFDELSVDWPEAVRAHGVALAWPE
jgi:hypothetical protein